MSADPDLRQRRLDDDDDTGSFARGLYSAFLIYALGAVIVWMLWIVATTAFAGAGRMPSACAEVSRADCPAAVEEAR
ncbi:hypothetical protein [Paracoccus tibetensis]|uniref:Uncharacterized protein n=1 Tax=Paracoccus tibetensis TaxID=336292 RepID=A0A1G5BGE5_9RHOB|nr:hypothetical protein [Paracoccus tibetensis]SCX89050.1 hypothetical protein SAMN05660710_00130 [Paracoccus tibetensis]